ncbi:MAG: hypothetical protein ACR2PM_07220 [Hyphomicrobiales bacterium]
MLAIDNLDGTITLTWDENADSFFDVDLTAFDDNATEDTESLTFTLSDASVLSGEATIDPAKTAATLNIEEDEIVVFGAQVITNSNASEPFDQILLLNISDINGILPREDSGIASIQLDLSEEGQQGFFPFDDNGGDTNPVIIETDVETAITLKYIQGAAQFNLTDFNLLDDTQTSVLAVQDTGNVQFSDGQGSGAQAAIWLLTPDAMSPSGVAVSDPIEVFISFNTGGTGLNEIVLDSSSSNTSFDLDLGLLSLVDDVTTPNDGTTTFFDEDLFGDTDSIDISGSQGSEANNLTLSAQDVMDLQEPDLTPEVFIIGDSNDSVELFDSDGIGNGTDWMSGASAGGFTAYTFGSVTVQIDDDLTVSVVD